MGQVYEWNMPDVINTTRQVVWMEGKRDGIARTKKKGFGAYFTVEATLVLPLVMSAVLLDIYLFCYQYDRCLLEQDIGSLMLWCNETILENADTAKGQEDKIKNRASEIYRDKYVAWELTTVDVQQEKNRITVVGRGQLVFPVPGWNFWNNINIWEDEVTYESRSISPVLYIRQMRKLNNMLRRENGEGMESP